MKLRTYVARAAALALILSPALMITAVSAQDDTPSNCHCSPATTPRPSTSVPTESGSAPEPTEEVKRIWTSP